MYQAQLNYRLAKAKLHAIDEAIAQNEQDFIRDYGVVTYVSHSDLSEEEEKAIDMAFKGLESDEAYRDLIDDFSSREIGYTEESEEDEQEEDEE